MNDWRYDNLTRFYLKSADEWYENGEKAALDHEKVEALDCCLDSHEKYEKYMHVLGYPIPAEREAFWNKAKAKRERYAQAQKDKEESESLQRINALFAGI
jgi:hypothetical protein